jgi:arylsulfatase A-like enzyme
MDKPGNILFIMCDQLRFDYLSCNGHPRLHTPNIDSLASRGVNFTNAYCQAPLCGPSRASFYTGRYLSSHGVMANEDTTRLDEKMLGDYLREAGYRCALVGKADNRKDSSEIERMGIDPESSLAQTAKSGGFEPYDFHEGLIPGSQENNYVRYLKEKGYESRNPWLDFANSGEDENGNIHSGWFLHSSRYAARVAEEHSESVYSTDRAIEFLDEAGSTQPWCLHLSYIKPHWPLIAPAPYHQMYGVDDLKPAVRLESERKNPHPVYQAFMQQEYSESYSRDDVRELTLPVYMGLIKQIDDQLGRLFEHMKQTNQFDNTMIVFTSDHGDYFGDHWLGEKDLLHEPSVKVPFIVANPSANADASRGSSSDEFVGAIDVLPTLVEFAGGKIDRERLEGRSLMPILCGQTPRDWREYVVAEIDYSDRGPRTLLDVPPYECRAVMIRDRQWKYIHYDRFRPQLFDLVNDPDELRDLGEESNLRQVHDMMRARLFDWQRGLKKRIGMPYENLDSMGPERDESLGIIIGRW